MNLKTKFRESFRPFAPAVLEEHCREYFELEGDSPYMLVVAPVVGQRRVEVQPDGASAGSDDLIATVNQVRSELPAITHVDYSARIQTVSKSRSPRFHAIIDAFRKRTGCSVVINTSFNVRGEPIVCTPEDAYRCFSRTEMDYLVLEHCVLAKADQPKFEDDENWRAKYALD
jgi:carbamoyltransferase